MDEFASVFGSNRYANIRTYVRRYILLRVECQGTHSSILFTVHFGGFNLGVVCGSQWFRFWGGVAGLRVPVRCSDSDLLQMAVPTTWSSSMGRPCSQVRLECFMNWILCGMCSNMLGLVHVLPRCMVSWPPPMQHPALLGLSLKLV